MRIPKRYGQYRKDSCPFCEKQAVTENKQGVPVCAKHKNISLEGVRCACGELLDVRKGKFGAYFYCWNCGNISFSKGMQMSKLSNGKGYKVQSKKDNVENKPVKKKYGSTMDKKTSKKPREITIRSDELDFYC